MEKKTNKKSNQCPYAKKCGGCDFQGIEYQKQLETKEANVKKLLKDFVIILSLVTKWMHCLQSLL